jgi:hypothetical protein
VEPPRGRSATQRRVERFAFGFDFDAARTGAVRPFGFATFFPSACFAAGRAGALAGLAAFAGAGDFSGADVGAATVAFTTGGGDGGFTGAGVRELDVLSGGSGCFRGRPLFRAACPSAISLSNAAFASASSRACCELRTLRARSFSARKRSSGRVGGLLVMNVLNMP